MTIVIDSPNSQQHEMEATLRKPSYSGRNRNKPGASNGTKGRFSDGVSEFPFTPWGRTPIPNINKTPSKSRIGDFLPPGPMLGPNSPKRSQSRPISQMVLPGFKNAFETSPKKSPGKGITKHMPVPFPPLPSANGRAEADNEWGSGVDGDGSPGGRKWKGKEKARDPIEEGDLVPMVVSPAKSLLPKLTQAQQPATATPRSAWTQLGVGSSPLASRFGDAGEFGQMDVDRREDEESDGDEFVPLSLAGEVRFLFRSTERWWLMHPLSYITEFSCICDLLRARPRSSFSWPSICLRQRHKTIDLPSMPRSWSCGMS